MTYNRLMTAFFVVYILKVPLALIFFLNGNIQGVFFTVLFGTSLEVFLFFFANTRPFDR